jgi:PBP1b-binding outer membrane lipoprotein LpoB
MKKIVIFLGLSIVLYSCCTKKECDQDYNPEIYVSFKGFDASDLTKISFFVTDTNSFKAIDSVTYLYSISNSFQIYNWMLMDKKIELKDYSFIIKTNVSSDTICKIRYEKYKKKIECNTCYPFGDGIATVINYKNFSYYYRQNKYVDHDTLVIIK